MQFGIVGQMDPRMRQVVGFGTGLWEEVIFGANLGYPIVTSGEFAA